jgi:hypothetical protein
LWGCYHGVLLVLHRQLQQVERKFDWNAKAPGWTAIAWIATMALISFGWILFRANSLPQARQMIEGVLSPRSYTTHFLSGSLYALVLALAVGYAIALLVIDALARYSEQSEPAQAFPFGIGIIAFAARWRWFWIPPLYAVALILLFVVTLTRGPSGAQLMYRRF